MTDEKDQVHGVWMSKEEIRAVLAAEAEDLEGKVDQYKPDLGKRDYPDALRPTDHKPPEGVKAPTGWELRRGDHVRKLSFNYQGDLLGRQQWVAYLGGPFQPGEAIHLVTGDLDPTGLVHIRLTFDAANEVQPED